MTNQELAIQYINANSHLGDKAIFDAARDSGKNRGFLIALAVELIEAAENAANAEKLAAHANYLKAINQAGFNI
jgi:hypothetical protein